MRKKTFFSSLALVVVTSALCIVLADDEKDKGKENPSAKKDDLFYFPIPNDIQPALSAAIEIDAPTEKAIQRGLKWLSEHQSPDGSFGKEYTVAVTSLSSLAFMANGSLPTRGKYSENVQRGLKFILAQQGASGFISEENGKQMHSHGYATMFLSEVYGSVDKNSKVAGVSAEDIKLRLKKSVNMISTCQSKNGGWFYYPNSTADEGSVTVTVVQALRAAKNAGIKVNDYTIERAFEYVRKSANEDGSISYSISDHSSSFALTAAGVSVLNYLGQYDGKEVDKGMSYLKRAYLDPEPSSKGSYKYYETFYAALCFWNSGGADWKNYFPLIREELISSQKEDGSWDDSSYGQEYATSFSLLILQIPYRYLPIFQR
ncbi:MAG: hypothetical protein A2W23_04205 [Planctomycetes bacterium RBG_16_43_13]|nr:MAG: hypothetical protein A2W23_04205 [Planctomycetes bacterium RBG_16_43_13]